MWDTSASGGPGRPFSAPIPTRHPKAACTRWLITWTSVLPAEKAGLRVGDELMVVDGRDARGPGYIFEDSPTREPGAMHAFTVRRGDELIELTITSTEPLGKDEKPADRCEEGKPSPS